MLGDSPPSNVAVEMVASTYVGDPPLDRRDLLAAGPQFMRRIERTVKPALTDQQIDDLVKDYLIDEMARGYPIDFLALDRAGSMEMGVSCVFRVFAQLPELPLTDTLGTDFVQRNLLHALGRPLVFHSRKVVHRFDHSRRRSADLSSAVEYALRDLRQLLYWRVWQEQATRIKECSEDLWPPSGVVDIERFCSAAERAARIAQPAMRHVVAEFGAAHLAAADATGGETSARLLETGRAALGDVNRFVIDVASGVADHCFLARHWTALVDVAAHSGERLERLALVTGGAR
jgi:hypothetical protein